MSDTYDGGAQASPNPSGGVPIDLKSMLPGRSVGLKLLLVCALALAMTIPAMLVYGVVAERSAGQQTAINEVSQIMGGSQAVLGPVLVVPFARTPDPEKPDRVVYGHAIAYADRGSASVDVAVTERKRGLYSVPVYEADITFDAQFDPGVLRDAVPEDADAIWADARVYMGVSDTRGIKEEFAVTANGQAVRMEPANMSSDGSGRYRVAPNASVRLAGGAIAGLEARETPIKLNAAIRITGAQRFAVGPFARSTTMSLNSNWADPSFTGGILPDRHTAGQSEQGFTASWSVPYMARGIPGSGANLDLSEVTGWAERDMAVNFIKEASPYQSVERALKYAAMFIGFVFLAYFLFEVASGARAHPAQYILIGLAQAIFYLLLLAFSERFGFDPAFAVAAVMTVGLTSFYAMTVFRSKLYGFRAFGVMSGIYALIYVLMRAQDNALLAGSLASFTAIALTMYMTRNVNWYGGDEPSET
ncbi:MAG: cell envelope integrity protein CreD [Pseudomonadota bacterium]